MKIPLHHSLKVARAVVNKVNLPKEIAQECSLGSWSNCREQGLCIKRYSRSINFVRQLVISECRNSDEILIVTGTSYDFDMQTNQPFEETYQKNRKYFRYDSQDKAAKFIEDFLKKT